MQHVYAAGVGVFLNSVRAISIFKVSLEVDPYALTVDVWGNTRIGTNPTLHIRRLKERFLGLGMTGLLQTPTC